MATEIIITACTREEMADIMEIYLKGRPVTNIAKRTKRSESALRKYIRLYETYGPDVFIEKKYAA